VAAAPSAGGGRLLLPCYLPRTLCHCSPGAVLGVLEQLLALPAHFYLHLLSFILPATGTLLVLPTPVPHPAASPTCYPLPSHTMPFTVYPSFYVAPAATHLRTLYYSPCPTILPAGSPSLRCLYLAWRVRPSAYLPVQNRTCRAVLHLRKDACAHGKHGPPFTATARRFLFLRDGCPLHGAGHASGTYGRGGDCWCWHHWNVLRAATHFCRSAACLLNKHAFAWLPSRPAMPALCSRCSACLAYLQDATVRCCCFPLGTCLCHFLPIPAERCSRFPAALYTCNTTVFLTA